MSKYTGVYLFSPYPTTDVIISEFFMFSLISVMALGSYQNKIGIEKIKLKGEKERAILLAELNLLNDQFNSNFTFTFLNYCQEAVHEYSLETAKAIETFSIMLHYSLNNNANSKSDLRKEIEYMENFIALHKLLNPEIRVYFSKETNNTKPLFVVPRILITPLENAFKHGNLYSINNPILVQLKTSNNSLNFKVINEKNKQAILEPSGIGNDNLKQQLELFYKGKYVLNVEEHENMYSTSLELLLN